MDLWDLFLLLLALCLLGVILHWLKMVWICTKTKTLGWPIPILGHSYRFLCPPEKLLARLEYLFNKYDKDESCITFFLGPRMFTIYYHPEPIAEIFNNTTSLLAKSHDYDFLIDWLGTGLLTSTGHKWRMRRKLLTPAFHFQILDDAQPAFNRQVWLVTKNPKCLGNSNQQVPHE